MFTDFLVAVDFAVFVRYIGWISKKIACKPLLSMVIMCCILFVLGYIGGIWLGNQLIKSTVILMDCIVLNCGVVFLMIGAVLHAREQNVKL